MMDLAFDVWLVLGVIGNWAIFKFLIDLKKCISCGYSSLRWLNNVRGVYLVQVSFLRIGQQGLGHFFRY